MELQSREAFVSNRLFRKKCILHGYWGVEVYSQKANIACCKKLICKQQFKSAYLQNIFEINKLISS